MRRILFVSGYHQFIKAGGAEYQTYIISESLRKSGNEVYFLSPNTHLRRDQVVYLNNTTIFLYRRRIPKFFGSSYLLEFNIVKTYLDKIQPHAIYQRGVSSLTLLLSLYAMRRGGCFVLALASDRNISPITLSDWVKKPLNALDRVVGRMGIRRANAVVVQTNTQLINLRKTFDIPGTLVRNIYHPQITRRTAQKKRQVICHCKYNTNKSPEACVKLAKLLPNVTFLIVGIENNKEKLQDFVGSRDIPDNLRACGILERAMFVKLLSESMILLSTSQFEGFPNTFIEAWFNRTVVVSLHVNPDNLLDSNRCGFYAKHNMAYLARIVAMICDNEHSRRAVAERSYQFAKEQFTLEKNIGVIESLFEETR